MHRGNFGRFGHRRKSKSKSTAFPRFALQRDFSPLLFDETLRDCQPQSRAFTGGIRVPLNLPEFLENDLLVLSSDTYPCIGYRYTNLVAIFNASDVDPAVLRREFDRIAKQVVQNLLKTHSIGIHRPVRLQLLLDLDIFRHCQWTDRGEDFRQSIPHLKVFTSQFELPGFDFREIQNVID